MRGESGVVSVHTRSATYILDNNCVVSEQGIYNSVLPLSGPGPSKTAMVTPGAFHSTHSPVLPVSVTLADG